MQLAKVYLIHESSDKEDAATGTAKDVLRCERVWNSGWIEACALVGNTDDQVLRIGLEGSRNLLGRIVRISMQDCVDRSLTDGHNDVRHGIFVKPVPCGEVFGGVLHGVNTLQRRGEREREATCSGIGQSGPLFTSDRWRADYANVGSVLG